MNVQLESISKVLIFNNKEQILVLKLGIHKANPAKSFQPDLPGGIIDAGEYEQEGAIREVEEETGIVLDSRELQLIYAGTELAQEIQKSIIKNLYVVYLGKTPEVTLSWEHESFSWMTLDEIISRKTFSGFFGNALEYVHTNKILNSINAS